MIINKTSNVVLLTTTNLLAILLTFPTNVAIAAPNCLDIINKGCASLPSTLTGKNKTCRITSAFGPMVSRCLSPGDFMFNKATTKHGKYQEPIRAICSGKVARTGFFLQGKEAYTVVTTHDFEEQCMFDGKKYDSFEIYYGHSDGGTSSVTVGSDVMAGDVFAYLNSCDTCKGMGPQSILMLLVKIGNVFVNPIALSHEAAAVEYTGSLARLDNSSPSPPVPPPLTLTLAGPCEAPSLNRYEIECGSKTFVFDMNHREGFSSEVNRSPPHTQDLNKPYFDQPRNPFSYGNNHTTRLVIPDDWIAGEASCNVVVKDIWGTTKWSGEEDTSGGQCPAGVRSMSPFGQQFTGEVDSVAVGTGLALSGNGRTMAVNSFHDYFVDIPDDDGDIPDDDYYYRRLEELQYYQNEWVQVYQMSQDDSTWTKLGKPVINVRDYGGPRKIHLSSDGKTLGLRLDFSFRLLSYDDAKDEWVPIGSDIDSKAFGSPKAYRFTFEMSADGRTMVVAWTQSRVMTARIFRYVDAEDKWIKLGDDISQSMSYGMVLSLSSDGRTFAVAGPHRTGVHVYSFDEGGNKWEKLGQTITTRSGIDISLSGNGRYLAVGEGDESCCFDGPLRVGSARVYSFDENEDDWVMVGQKLEGKSKYDGFGVRVILSDDACSLAVSATADCMKGEVLTFYFDGTEWKQRGDAVSAFGMRVKDIIAFSGDGSVVATTTVGSKTFLYGTECEYIDGYVATYRTS